VQTNAPRETAPAPVAADPVGDRRLAAAATLFTVAVVLHNGDHVRRGADTVSRGVFALGTSGVVLEVLVVVLVCARHRLAPLVATAAGALLAAGYVFVHFLPARSWLSDSFTSGAHVSPLSWIAASLEVVAAVVLSVAGGVTLAHRGGTASAARRYPAQRSIRSALGHPLVVTLLVTQTAVVIVSFAQR
jgi:hypothetical protein